MVKGDCQEENKETFLQSIVKLLSTLNPGSGGGSVGRAVASNTRDPRFKSRYRRSFIYQLYIRNDENKEAGNGPSFFFLTKVLL